MTLYILMSLYVLMTLYILITCLSLYVIVCPYMSLYVIIYHYASPYICHCECESMMELHFRTVNIEASQKDCTHIYIYTYIHIVLQKYVKSLTSIGPVRHVYNVYIYIYTYVHALEWQELLIR